MTDNLYNLYKIACSLASRHSIAEIRALEEYEKEYGKDADADSRFMAGVANGEGSLPKEALEKEQPND